MRAKGVSKEAEVIGAAKGKPRAYVRPGYRVGVNAGAHENSRAGHVAQSTET